MRLVFDCDDVLADFTASLGEAYNQKYGTVYRQEDFGPDPTHWKELLGPDAMERMYTLFDNGEYAKNLKPVLGSVETIRALHAAGDELFVVTSRNGLSLDITPNWLKQMHGPVFQDVIYAKLTPDDERPTKGEICQRLNPDAVVDDLTRHVADISSRGIPCMLYDQRWNRDYGGNGLVTRVVGHEGIREYVERMRQKSHLPTGHKKG